MTHHFSKQALEILETIPNSFYVLDKSWNFVYVNAQIEKLIGKTLEELVGTQYWDVFPKSKFGHLYDQFAKANETGQMVWFREYSPLYNKWFEISVYPTNAGFAVYVLDVTERKKTEDDLIETKEELQDFLDNAAVGIHGVNDEGMIIYVNRAELELLGYSKDEYLGRNIAEFYVDQNIITDILRRLKNKEEVQSVEVQLRAKNGTIRHVLVSSNVAWKGDQFIHTRCFTRDITPRKKNEKLLVLLNQVSQQLVAELDLDIAINKVAKLLVPAFSDWFAIYILKNNKVQLLQLEHSNTSELSSATSYRRSHDVNLNKFKPNSLAWVLKIGKPVYFERISNSDLENIAIDIEELQLLQSLQLRSLIMIPMIMNGSVIGAVSFTSVSDQTIFDVNDYRFAQDVVSRIAFSLENARLYDENKSLRAKQIRENRKNTAS